MHVTINYPMAALQLAGISCGNFTSLGIPKKRKVQSRYSESTSFNIQEYLTTKKQNINKALQEAIPLRYPTILHEAMRYGVLAGGKRLFPLTCIAACELVGGDESLAMPMACALEMMKTESLVIDDLPCMDNDDLRRGKPASHKVFGEATTINACHALFCYGIEYITMNYKNMTPDRVIKAIAEICITFGSQGLLAGQFIDLTSEGKEVSLRELESIHRYKTSKFFGVGVVCGALVGGASEGEIERFRRFGECLGLAYQVWDDVLDIIGSKEKLGKTPGKDMVCDKATYPKLMGLDESKKYARELVNQAKEELLFFDSMKAAPFYHVADYIVSRTM